MNIVVGSYEELILAYEVIREDEGYTFKQQFTDHSHMGCVKTLSISDHGILATGSTDEIISLFDIVKNKELGQLRHHTGTITSLSFKDGHLFSTSEDGTIIAWKTTKWEPIRTLKGHKGAVCDLAIHPSGKLALSIGNDRTLRTWNLITGKCAFTTNLKSVAENVLWSPDGDTYVVLYKAAADVYKVETGTVAVSIRPGTALSTALFIKDQVLAVAGSEGIIYLYNSLNGQQILKINTETTRVKIIKSCKHHEDQAVYLVTASSEGLVKLWNLEQIKESEWKSELLATHDCKFRPTSLAVANPSEYIRGAQAQTEKTNESNTSVSKRSHTDDQEEHIVVKKQKTSKGPPKKETSGRENKKQGAKNQKQKHKTVKLDKKVKGKKTPKRLR